MAMINRISRLFKADLNSILDQIEEPEQLLKQAIRDMHDELTETEQRIKLRLHDQQTVAGRVTELEKTLAEINEQLGFCFESNKDDLARNQIRKKLELNQLLSRLNARQAANARFIEVQQATLLENQATLEALRQKSELFARQTPAQASESSEIDDLAWTVRTASIGEEEVEIAFLREKSVRKKGVGEENQADKGQGTQHSGRSS